MIKTLTDEDQVKDLVLRAVAAIKTSDEQGVDVTICLKGQNRKLVWGDISVKHKVKFV